MLTRIPDRAPQIGFLLLPRFSLLGFSAALEPLRLANMLSGRELYRWTLMSSDGQPAPSSSGMLSVPDRPMSDLDGLDALIVAASWNPERVITPPVIACVRRAARRGLILGALETGTYALARARALDGYQATIHWEEIASFGETFPDILIKRDLFVVDRDRFTSAGGASGLDMMLHLIAADHGQVFANRMAEEFIHADIRGADAPQRMPVRRRLQAGSPRLARAVELMEATLEEPLTVDAVARRSGVSMRELERLFRRWLRTTPARYYRELRLMRARALLQQTDLPVTEIAMASGFASAAHFSRCYRQQFGHPPTVERGFLP